MKKKLFQNYYTKLTLVCILSVFILVFVLTVIVLGTMHSEKIALRENVCNEILQEIEENFYDISKKFYTIFMPLTDSNNVASLQEFCKGEEVGYNRYEVEGKLKNILASVSRQDSRIKGIYFRRFSDDEIYLYLDEERDFKKASFSWEEAEAPEEYQRSILGGRKLKLSEISSKDKYINVFGIQSGILSSGKLGKEYSYQITVLYDLASFDKILQKYDVDSKARFLITSTAGAIVYDSKGQYTDYQESYFEGIERITGGSNTVTEEGITYLKEMKYLKQGKWIAFYMVPQKNITHFQLDGIGIIVILFAIIINVLLFMVVFFINRMINRKFQMLKSGMKQIGKNNLSYRIPVGAREDEFEEIAIRFNQMCDELEDMIDKNYVYQMLQQNAEYKALQTSVNPHFLYNSLEAIREKMYTKGQEDEAEMVLLLSRIFEYQIRGDSMVNIEREQEALQNYIDFSSIRYQYSFDYDIDIDPEILKCPIPKQIFQPIMENYFAHGYREDEKDYICVLGYRDTEDGMIHVCFCDNGKGLTGEQIERLNASLDETCDVNSNSHIGLRNVHKRLKIAFGDESHIEISSNAPEPGISVSLVFGQILRLDRL